MAGNWADDCLRLAAESREYFRDAYWWDSYWLVFNDADEVAEQIYQGILEFAVPQDAEALNEILALLRKTATHMINSTDEIKKATAHLDGWTGSAATEVKNYIVSVETSHEHVERIVDALYIAADAYDNLLDAMQKDVLKLIQKARNACEDGDDITADVGAAVAAAITATAKTGLSAGGAAIVSSVLEDSGGKAISHTFSQDGVYASEELVGQLHTLRKYVVEQVKNARRALDAVLTELANTKIPAIVELPSIVVEKAFDASQFTLDEPDYRREVDERKISDKPLIEERRPMPGGHVI